MNKLIEETMLELKKQKLVFHSEADFKYKLAWTLNMLKPELEIILEYSEPETTSLTDIVVIDKGIKYPIELKYFTKPHKLYPYLKKQNDTYRVYKVMNDIKRIEDFINRETNKGIGYSIVLSNHNSYWEPTIKKTSNHYNFRISDGRRLKSKTELKWLNTKAKSHYVSYGSIELLGEYKFNWKEYYKNASEKLEFKYLINIYNPKDLNK